MSSLFAAVPASRRRAAILARIGALLADLYDEPVQDDAPRPGMAATAADAAIDGRLESFARTLYYERRLRDELFGGDLTGEPGWDMLLDLFVQGGARRSVPVFAIRRRAGIRPMTARRWLDLLVAQRLVERSADPHQQVGDKIRLTASGKEQLRSYLIETLARREQNAAATRPKSPATDPGR